MCGFPHFSLKAAAGSAVALCFFLKGKFKEKIGRTERYVLRKIKEARITVFFFFLFFLVSHSRNVEFGGKTAAVRGIV